MGEAPVPPLVTDPQRSALMARIRQRGTKPELLVAVALKGLRLGYRKNARDLPGSPDFVNRLRRWAIFVNGCYWHHHRCRRGTVPKRNREFWTNKFAANRRRDARAIRELRRKGYAVVLVWECEVADGEAMLAKLARLVPAAGRMPGRSNEAASRSVAGTGPRLESRPARDISVSARASRPTRRTQA